jgi:uncharacterized protein YbjT (DUF2867 family)
MGQVVTVFGGTGFLGRRIVRHVRQRGFSVRIASRHARPAPSEQPQLRAVVADIRDRRSIAAAVAGASAVVNAVSLYGEGGTDTFEAVHVVAAAWVAEEARKAGVERLVQVSGIGANAASASRYIRARGQGEQAVRAAFANSVVIRPAVMFGPDDQFLKPLVRLLRWLPVYPMFGRGQTRLQPADVEDVAEAVARLMPGTPAQASTLECGGPRVYTWKELLESIARAENVRRILVPVPFAAWQALALLAEALPGAPITRNQLELIEIDTVVSAGIPGFAELGIAPRAMEEVLLGMLRRA